MAYVMGTTLPAGWSLAASEEESFVSLEVNEVPHLNMRQRRVGFQGTKLEDLNKSPVFARAWLSHQLPNEWHIHAGWTPPIRVRDVKPKTVVALVLAKEYRWSAWRMGVAAQGGINRIDGDFTCSQDVVDGFDPDGNPFGCSERSKDELNGTYFGVELGGLWQASKTLHPFASLAWHRIDVDTQVNAQLGEFRDQSLLKTDGDLWTAQVGAQYAHERFDARLSVAYTPLEIQRFDDPRPRSDDLLQVRLTLSPKILTFFK